MQTELLESLVTENTTKIVLLVMDGLGGLPLIPGGKTELETAETPNLDKLSKISSCGLLDPISAGITPGSGPAHLGLFGYDPVKYNIGRGVLSALGIDFNLKHGDICTRGNFATIDKNGIIIDRRAGRISTETNIELCKMLRNKIKLPEGFSLFIEPEKEHRVVLIIRGEGLDENISDTDPQKAGLKPLDTHPLKSEAKKSADLFSSTLKQTKEILKDQPNANMILLRGFAGYHSYPTMQKRFLLKSLAIACYPMYRGLAKLVGMDVPSARQNMEESIKLLKGEFNNYDFFYIHAKKTDSYGEDGNFEAKVHAIEQIDSLLPEILSLKPDVLAVTGDHSTPAKLKAHSWHPNPVLLHSQYCRQDNLNKFSETECRSGSLGRQASINLMPLMLANALRLQKFGA